MLRRLFSEPVAAKVPEVTALFWVVKVLTTAGGEAASDWLALGSRLVAGAIETLILIVALAWQFRTRRYVAAAYWSLAYAIAIFGTGVSDALHLEVGLPYAVTTALWAVVLAAVFTLWYRSERTLSIHSIVTTRREIFYWATVLATFALGTALGDFTAVALGIGFLASGILFGILILLPGLAWWKLRLDAVAAFWMSYVLTRPLGASFADYFSKPHSLSGLDLGDGPVAVAVLLAVALLVGYLAVRRNDIQPPGALAEGRPQARQQPAPMELGLPDR